MPNADRFIVIFGTGNREPVFRPVCARRFRTVHT
jgi:hypothetical protein